MARNDISDYLITAFDWMMDGFSAFAENDRDLDSSLRWNDIYES